ncbi:MAG: diguanylate cyclase [Gammaproteobacteria bacterium]|nr:diguanylate cyclase [Gammaproteobacteria bacterium]
MMSLNASTRRLQRRKNFIVRWILVAVFAAAPQLALAQITGAGSGIVFIVVAGALLLVSALAVFFYLKGRRQQAEIIEQSETIEHVIGERDEALAELSEKKREIEESLSGQISELEEKNEELSAATARLRKLIVVDELTQLSNRQHFDQVIPHEIKRALREEKAFSIILGRFDWAEAFRQSYGDSRFDEAMQKIADEVRTIFRRAGDLPARYDDDSFAIIFTSDGDVAVRFAERLCKAVWNIPIPHDASETADRVTFSVGVATILPNRVHDPADILTAAETAVKIASDEGGNKVERYRKPSDKPAAV